MRTLLKPLFHSFLVLGSVIALSNCGNSKNEDDSQIGTTVPRQKNAALSTTTVMGAPKVVNPNNVLPTTIAPLLATTTTASTGTTQPPVLATTTTVNRTYTTPPQKTYGPIGGVPTTVKKPYLP
jgi:hypothetical protein